MRAPISFVYGNCVFGEDLTDGWAAFAVEQESYAWLTSAEKHARFLALVGALESAEADVQVLRVGGRPREDPERASPAARRRETHARYMALQRDELAAREATSSALYLLVSLRRPELDLASYVSTLASQRPGEWLEAVRRNLFGSGRRTLSAAVLERARVRADRAHARLADFLRVRPARGIELQWLVRRGFCRGLGEPVVDGLYMPSALLFERNGQAELAPLEADLLRWVDCEIEEQPRVLAVESELGASWQAHLVLGAVPELVRFPSSRAELMFAPPEELPFGIDIAVTARFLPNDLALRMARRKIQDADQILRAETVGEQGASDLGFERTQEARDLLSYLQASSRPPLLRATIAIAVGASSERELERRVELVRRAYGEVRLHRPLGDQLPLFLQHLPAQRTRVPGFEDVFTAEQLAAMMPTATHVAGASNGYHLGHTLSGSRRPVRFNLREGSDRDGNATILSVGALGSGKTTLAQKLQYEGFLQGARVVDCDPKGDHRFHLLEDVAPHVETLALRPDPALRGVLDPLRVAPAHMRQEATVSFLRDLLPGGSEAAWETSIVAAVDRVITRSARPSCLEVVRALGEGDEVDAQVARTLEVYSRSGLTQLGFADPAVELPSVGAKQVTYIPIRDLPGPAPDADRTTYSQAERVGEQIVRLIAMLALHLMSAERARLKLFAFDEGWRLLSDPVGRTLLASLQRMGRSELAVPIISTQLVGDALVGERESLENLIGATFVFGMRSHAEASRALALLGLDPEDASLQRLLLGLQAGRCLFRDHRGRVEAIQVELLAPWLSEAFSTTPRR
ncbi:MAG TPA: ATP-binding protein [Solirubrobacteraceae bacterium]|nr:ATP-binding protein [Solirubrobacteraceae bacterium]